MRSYHAVSCKAVIFNKNRSKILICFYGGERYGVAGGHLEQNETIDDAMRREIREETGITAIDDLQRFDFMQHNDGKVCLIYTCSISEDHETHADGEEVQSLLWVDANDIASRKYNMGSYQSLLERMFNLTLSNDDND